MDIYSVVDQRRSVRGFLADPVERDVIERVLSAACRAPSGGNLQPWHLYVLTGDPLRALVEKIRGRLTTGSGPDAAEYEIYPPKLASPYRDRRFRCGEMLHESLAIPRSDRAARERAMSRNFEFFGAPVGLFSYLDRAMGSAQWSDLGMYLQTVMLLLHAEGLGSCAQEAWSLYHRSVAEVVAPPEHLMLFCGMSIEYPDPDHPTAMVRTERAPLTDVSTFLGFGEQ